MEGLDPIIIGALRELGCIIDKNVVTIKELPDEEVVKGIIYCLNTIDEEYDFNVNLPSNMSQRVSACAEVAQAIKDIGYSKGDVGYYQILYPKENDTRNILSFLTSKLPNKFDGDNQMGEVKQASENSKEIFYNTLKNKIKIIKQETWTPDFCITSENRTDFSKRNLLFTEKIDPPFIDLTKVQSRSEAKERQEFIASEQQFITEQPERRSDVAPSIIELNFATYTEAKEREEEWNKNGLDSGLNPWQYRNRKRSNIVSKMSEYIRYNLEESEVLFQKAYVNLQQQQQQQNRITSNFINKVKYTQEESTPIVEISEEEIIKQREEQITDLQDTLTQLREKIEYIKNEMESFVSRMRQSDAELLKEIEKYENLEEEYRINKKVFTELLQDPENSIRLLKQISKDSAQRLTELAQQWEKYRTEVIDSYRKAKFAYLNRDEGVEELLEEIKVMRGKMKDLEGQIQDKDVQYKELLDIYRQLPKNMNRSVYTKRILDIVKQVKKQKVDISKILIDTRSLQKDINNNIETLGRIFALTTETVYKDAKKDPTAKQAYYDLCSLHDKFKELSDTVSDIGSTSNQILDLEERVQQVTIRAGSLDLDQIQNDLAQVKQENVVLIQNIKKRKLQEQQ
eukprot:TRINITY_DN746_c0_g1_i1.p1 TRINITY_DN746_c0_g1~~TRINITY_DN746_c0_g1_i1.p1  ORF type:complete len:627 (+),score=251.48 TRINITY_DN746_c0_g1_i1:144-2024(+)